MCFGCGQSENSKNSFSPTEGKKNYNSSFEDTGSAFPNNSIITSQPIGSSHSYDVSNASTSAIESHAITNDCATISPIGNDCISATNDCTSAADDCNISSMDDYGASSTMY